MKGQIGSLIYREWCIMKKSFILSGTAVFCIMLMMTLFALSAKYGNLARQIDGGNKELKTLSDMFIFSVTFLIPYCAMAAALDSGMYISDIRAGWTRYSITLPVSTKTKALAHTLFLAIRTGAALVFSVIVVASVNAAMGTAFNFGMLADIGIICILSLLFAVMTEICQSLPKDEILYKKRQNICGMVFIGLGLLLGLYMAKASTKYTEEFAAANGDEPVELIPPELTDKYFAFRNAAAPFILPVIILLIIGIYFIVKKNLDKQKKL